MIRQVYRVGFTVSDLDPVLAFYTQVLPFEIIDDCVAPRFIEGARFIVGNSLFTGYAVAESLL